MLSILKRASFIVSHLIYFVLPEANMADVQLPGERATRKNNLDSPCKASPVVTFTDDTLENVLPGDKWRRISICN